MISYMSGTSRPRHVDRHRAPQATMKEYWAESSDPAHDFSAPWVGLTWEAGLRKQIGSS